MNKIMKKLVSILAVCLALTSCDPVQTHEEWQREQDYKYDTRITKFNYEGHSYLLYQYQANTRNAVAGICHDENCPCKKSIPTD